MKYSRRDPSIKPRFKGRREFSGRNPMQRDLPPLPDPLREEMKTIEIDGKEYQVKVKIYASAQESEDPNFAYPSSRKVPAACEL